MSKKPGRSFLFHLGVVLLLSVIIVVAVFATLHWLTKHGEEVIVPKVAGTDLNTATATLRSRHFEVYVDSVYEPALKPLRVLKQVPDSGAAVKEGRTIFLTVNMLVPPHIRMPNLVDLSFRSAQMLLRNNKLLMGDTIFVPDIASGAVRKQLYKGEVIRPGEMISQGSRISLVVGNGLGNTEFDMPSVMGLSVDEAVSILKANDLQTIIVPYDQMTEISDTLTAIVVDQRPRPLDGAGKPNMVKAGEIIDLIIIQNPTQQDMISNTTEPAHVSEEDTKKNKKK